MVFTHPVFSALCYCCHLVPFVNSKLLATTPILERASYGKGSECLRVNCKHPLKEDSDVLVGRANKLRWTKVYKGSELRGDWGGRNEDSRLRRSVVSPKKPPFYASYREKKAFLILEKSFEGRWNRSCLGNHIVFLRCALSVSYLRHFFRNAALAYWSTYRDGYASAFRLVLIRYLKSLTTLNQRWKPLPRFERERLTTVYPIPLPITIIESINKKEL